MRIVPTSHRQRRRLAWIGLAVAALAGVILAVLLVPGSPQQTTEPTVAEGPAQVVTQERTVPLTAADRREINALLDRFVPAAAERRDPALAWSLAGPQLRGSTTRADWLAGRLPVYPYSPRDTTFHGWSLDWSTEHSVGIDLLMHPKAGTNQTALAFRIELHRYNGRWLVDYWLPIASFAPTGKKPAITSSEDLKPQPTPSPSSGTISIAWILVPLGIILAAAVLVPTGIALVRARRRRRLHADLPPPPRELPPLPSSITRRPPPADDA